MRRGIRFKIPCKILKFIIETSNIVIENMNQTLLWNKIEKFISNFNRPLGDKVQWPWLGGWNPTKKDYQVRVAIRNLDIDSKTVIECYGLPIHETTLDDYEASFSSEFCGYKHANLIRELLVLLIDIRIGAKLVVYDCNRLEKLKEWSIKGNIREIKRKADTVFRSGKIRRREVLNFLRRHKPV